MFRTRVGIFSWDFEPAEGGIGVHTAELYRALLSDKEFEPIVFSPLRIRAKNHFTIGTPNFFDLGQIFFSLKCAIQLEELIKKHKLGIVHFMGGSGGVQLLVKPPVPAVFTLNNTYFYLHHNFPTLKFGILKWLEHISLKYADCITAVSRGIADEINREENFNIQVVHIGVDDKLFFPHKTKRENIVLYSGRLKERKGLLELIEAFAKCKHKGFELWFVGNGQLLDMLIEKSVALGINNRVKFFPHVDRKKLPMFYSKAFVTVLPSWSEGFGLVIAEAMKCGSIVLGSNIPGIIDQIEGGKTGFFFRAKDIQDLSQKLDQIMGATNLEQIRKNSLKKAQGFSLAKMTDSYKNVYKRLLAL